MSLRKRSFLFSRAFRIQNPSARSFLARQRERVVLDADAKPEFGVKQPMPPRKAKR